MPETVTPLPPLFLATTYPLMPWGSGCLKEGVRWDHGYSILIWDCNATESGCGRWWGLTVFFPLLVIFIHKCFPLPNLDIMPVISSPDTVACCHCCFCFVLFHNFATHFFTQCQLSNVILGATLPLPTWWGSGLPHASFYA